METSGVGTVGHDAHVVRGSSERNIHFTVLSYGQPVPEGNRSWIDNCRGDKRVSLFVQNENGGVVLERAHPRTEPYPDPRGKPPVTRKSRNGDRRTDSVQFAKCLAACPTIPGRRVDSVGVWDFITFQKVAFRARDLNWG